MNKFLSIGIIALFLNSCAWVVTYGVAPYRDKYHPDIYYFTLYYNTYTGSSDLLSKLDSEVSKFLIKSQQSEKSYYSFQTLDYEHFSSNQKIIYKVKFYSNDKGGKNDNVCIKGDCQNGYGTKEFYNGERYVGEFENGRFDGKGTYIYNRTDWTCVGEFDNGSSNGFGTCTDSVGTGYVGEFKDGKYHGKGIISATDGVMIGMFENGSFIEEIHCSSIMDYFNNLYSNTEVMSYLNNLYPNTEVKNCINDLFAE